MPVSSADYDSSLYPILSTFLSNLSNKEFLPIVHTNAIPDEALASSITADLHKSRIELSELDLEIYEWEKRLKHLKWLWELRKRCRDAIRRHEAVLSPIRRLPIELISQIMLFASAISRPSLREDGYPIINYYSCLDNEWRVRSLALVCTDWREAALACPRIWSHIIFCPKYSTSEQLQMHINRAGSVSLSFTQCEVSDHWRYPNPFCRPHPFCAEIELLSKAQIMNVSSSSTWTSTNLYIDINNVNSTEYVLHLKEKLHSLQYLKLRIEGDSSRTTQSIKGWSLVQDLLKDAHSLVKLELSSDLLTFDSKSITPPRSLRSLTFCTATEGRYIHDDLGPVLESCSSLESLTLGDGFNFQRPVCLPSLRDLSFLDLSSETITQASNLRLPLLESLSLVHFSDKLFKLFAIEAPFTHWRSENLRRIILIHPIPDWLDSTERAFLKLVKQLPAIDTLQFVSYTQRSPQTFSWNSRRISFPKILSYFDFKENQLLPRLKNLAFKVYHNRTLEDCFNLELPGPTFFNVLKSRGYGDLLTTSRRALDEMSNNSVKEDESSSDTAVARLETFSWISDIPLGISRDNLPILDAYVQGGLCYESRVMMYS
jgi:hypothetical protein